MEGVNTQFPGSFHCDPKPLSSCCVADSPSSFFAIRTQESGIPAREVVFWLGCLEGVGWFSKEGHIRKSGLTHVGSHNNSSAGIDQWNNETSGNRRGKLLYSAGVGNLYSIFLN